MVSREAVCNKSMAGLLCLGGFAFLLMIELLLVLRVPFVTGWFYVFAWWSYICGMEGVNQLRLGYAPLLSRPDRILPRLLVSVVSWLVFEAANFILENWYYIHLVSNPMIRWLGYSIAFATVLPGIMETYCWLSTFPFFRGWMFRGFPLRHRFWRGCQVIGWACILLSLLFPVACYPVIWGGVFLLVDPWNAMRGKPSLLQDLARGEVRRVLLLLCAGILCGGLWEFWNYWATAKWAYRIPFLGHWRIFEMPVMGFLGFPPFALECFALYQFGETVIDWACGQYARKWIVGGIAMLFAIMVYRGIDHYTVASFAVDHHAHPLMEIAGVSDTDAKILEAHGIVTLSDLIYCPQLSEEDALALRKAIADFSNIQKKAVKLKRFHEKNNTTTIPAERAAP